MLEAIRKTISRDLIYTGLNQVWRIVAGGLTILLIPLYLTSEAQGYWFTITGLAALIVFADLGFSTIITQFAAHEFAHLSFDKNSRIIGNDNNLGRLSTFFMFSMRWTLFLIIITSPIIFGTGFFILYQKQTDVHWLLPWTVYLIGTAITFLNNTVLCFLEGCNLVGMVQRLKLDISIVMLTVMLVGLVLGLNLYALSISMLLSALIGIYLIHTRFKVTIRHLIESSKKYSHPWIVEFFPLLWRYAISWASGYFIFQFITPLVFYYHGAVEAGRVGISIAMWTALYNIAHVWVYVVRPRLNFYVSRKEWNLLDRMFYTRLLLSGATFIIASLSVFLLKGYVTMFDRFVNTTSMLFLAGGWFLHTVSSAYAVYLRAHREEPLAVLGFVSAVYIVFTTFLCAKYLTSEYLFLGYFSSYLWGLPWVLFIFYQKRKLWHGNLKDAGTITV